MTFLSIHYIQNQTIITVSCKIIGLWLKFDPCISLVRKIRIMYWNLELTLGSLRRLRRLIILLLKSLYLNANGLIVTLV